MNDPTVETKILGGELRDAVRSSPVDRAQLSAGAVLKTALLYLYLLRFQILTLLLIWPGLYLAFQTPLLRGLADLASGGLLDGRLGVFLVSFATLMTVLSAVVSANITLIYGHLRLSGTDASPTDVPLNPPRRFFAFVPALVVYAMFLWSLSKLNPETPEHPVWFWPLALAGALVGVAFVFSVNWLQFRLANATCGQKTGVFLAIPFDVLGKTVLNVFMRAYRKSRPGMLEGDGFWLTFRKIAEAVGVGYVSFDKDRKPLNLLPGHLVNMWLVLVSLCIYLGAGWFEFSALNSSDFRHSDWEFVPTLAWALAGIGLLCVILSGIAFFLDRYRVPVLTALTGLLLLISQSGPTDHVYNVKDLNKDQFNALLSPRDVLSKFPDRMILVSAAGGGIQSGAWTAQVLSGLQYDNRMDQTLEPCKDYPENRFDPAVAAITAVSGGSVGTLAYLTSLPGYTGDRRKPCDARDSAAKSALEAAAWGLVVPDLQRIAFPLSWLPWAKRDRGWALERSIAAHAGASNVTLASLGQNVGRGLPAVLFNSTSVEQSEPLVFSNTRFPSPADDVPALAGGALGFFDLCANYDVNVETAARMSATFPWVSPAARADLNCNSDHLVDGGYYDNYGMSTLNAWLRQGLGAKGLANVVKDTKKREILFIRITGFPDDKLAADRAEPWYYQLYVPLLTLYGVRGKGQKLRDEAELWAFQQLLKDTQNIDITPVEFQYNPMDCACASQSPPLSWHLSLGEIDCIRKAWTEPRLTGVREQVRCFLDKSAKGCPQKAE